MGPQGPPGPGCDESSAPTFAGFTPQSFTGNLAGRQGAHAKCNAAFSGSRLCHASEYLLTYSTVQVPSSGAWLDSSMNGAGGTTMDAHPNYTRGTGTTCLGWTSEASSGTSGTAVLPGGSISSGSSTNLCDQLRPLACCYADPPETFVGFTGTTTGAMNGRQTANGMCGSAWPGTHMCHAGEYIRAASAASVPAPGAWVDWSTTASGSGSTGGEAGLARVNNGSNCAGWTTLSLGTVILPGGTIGTGASCSEPRKVACCL